MGMKKIHKNILIVLKIFIRRTQVNLIKYNIINYHL